MLRGLTAVDRMTPASTLAVTPGGAGESRAGPAGRLETLAVVHVAALLVFTAWDFGGETDLAWWAICLWGSLSLPLMVLVCARRMAHHHGRPPALRWLWPLGAFDVLVLLSTLNPSFRATVVGHGAAFVLTGANPNWPSSARPSVTLRELWQFNAIYLSAFNLLIAVVRRRTLRTLLWVLAANTTLLAILGTFQKLAHASGIFFGLQPSPNEEFFATFIYHNHWGAYVLLALAAAVALLFHHARHDDPADRRHSPVPLALVAILFLAASVPLSASRSCTLLAFVFLTGALGHWWRRLRRASGRVGALPSALLIAFVLLGGAGIYWLDRPVIDQRIDTTRSQLEKLRRLGNLGSREQLYADTWRMAQAKPWFGWGLGSYGTVFQIYNQQVSVEGWEPYFAEAHSDWLQALAEVGRIGTALIVLAGLLPLLAALRRGRPGAVPTSLLAGCALLAAYAWVEFPFANPAVLEAFWVGWFAALRYHRLTLADP